MRIQERTVNDVIVLSNRELCEVRVKPDTLLLTTERTTTTDVTEIISSPCSPCGPASVVSTTIGSVYAAFPLGTVTDESPTMPFFTAN